MATHEVAHYDVGVYAQTLTANTVDTVSFDNGAAAIEVFSSGAAALYFTTDGTTPTVGGAHCHQIPAVMASRTVEITEGASDETAVKLISASTPEYSVARAGVDS